MRGNHTFKVVADFRRYRFDNINGGGTSIFGSIFTSSSDAAGSGAPFADFLIRLSFEYRGKQLLDWSPAARPLRRLLLPGRLEDIAAV